ncbi:MAG: hypothetical protein AAB439_02435 [Patescibacteria group bacterium]
MRKISYQKSNTIQRLRKKGKSIPEISRETGVPITTVQRYVQGVVIPLKFQQALKEKQGGSKERARGLRENIYKQMRNEVGVLSRRDRFLLLIGLYWGEGAKQDFSIINSDPLLIKTFIHCLHDVGIFKDRLSVSVRIYNDMSPEHAKDFWSSVTGVKKDFFRNTEIVEGKKKGKLPYGMCRVRVKSGIKERLKIQAAISVIGKIKNNKVLSS